MSENKTDAGVDFLHHFFYFQYITDPVLHFLIYFTVFCSSTVDFVIFLCQYSIVSFELCNRSGKQLNKRTTMVRSNNNTDAGVDFIIVLIYHLYTNFVLLFIHCLVILMYQYSIICLGNLLCQIYTFCGNCSLVLRLPAVQFMSSCLHAESDQKLDGAKVLKGLGCP